MTLLETFMKEKFYALFSSLLGIMKSWVSLCVFNSTEIFSHISQRYLSLCIRNITDHHTWVIITTWSISAIIGIIVIEFKLEKRRKIVLQLNPSSVEYSTLNSAKGTQIVTLPFRLLRNLRPDHWKFLSNSGSFPFILLLFVFLFFFFFFLF